MFERRLLMLLWSGGIAGLVLVLRLFQLQVVNGTECRRLADASLIRPPQYISPVRGRIIDRGGAVLAADEPGVDLCMHYGVLAMRPAYLKALVRQLRRDAAARGTRSMDEDGLREEIRSAWVRISQVTGESLDELKLRRDSICSTVETMRRRVWERRRKSGSETAFESVVLAEETTFHPLIHDVPPDVRTQLELKLAGLPFVKLEPSVRRRPTADSGIAMAMAHLLGSMGEVSPSKLENDPNADDELTRYRPGEMIGVSGIERLADDVLRGRRGIEQRDLDGHLIHQDLPVNGKDVRLSIDTALQQRTGAILTAAVAAHPPSTGAACAVIALPSREVLALVSVPTYDPRGLAHDRWVALRDDMLHRPLIPRVIADEYPPGSLAKPATLLSALAQGRFTPSTVVECRGALFPDVNAWHCWTHWKHLAPHGPMDGVSAIQHSCNVYFYTAGGRLGAADLVRGLTDLFYGPAAGGDGPRWHGTGLIEERDGSMPTPKSLKRSYVDADARNYAIGQGELLVTPLQAANLMATIACGNFLDPSLIVSDVSRTPRPFAHIRAEHWALVRSGLYRCVNEHGGTAYPEARVDAVLVCGKTGSAQSVPQVVSRYFEFESADGSRVSVTAPSLYAARERLGLAADARPVVNRAAVKLPENVEGKDEPPTHAWFAGFAPREDPKIALSVLIEYGGGGGKVAAPVGRQVFEAILESGRGDLPVDGRYSGVPDVVQGNPAEEHDE